jgi:hypothetical protein
MQRFQNPTPAFSPPPNATFLTHVAAAWDVEQRDGGQLDVVVLRTAFNTDEAYQQWRELQLLLQNRVSCLSDPNPPWPTLLPPVRPRHS